MKPRAFSGLCLALVGIGVSACSDDAPPAPVDTSVERLVPEQYDTIESAILVSRPGDRISLAPGTYEGIGNVDLRIDGTTLDIVARDPTRPTIIDLSGEGRAFEVVGDGRLTVEGLVLLDGHAGTGGAIRLSLGRVWLRDVRIQGATAEFAGAISVDQGLLDLDGCELLGNAATRGDGGAIFAGRAELRIRRTLIAGNYAAGAGGALSLDRSTALLQECTVAANLAGHPGGALEVWRESVVRLDRSIVWGNGVEADDPTGRDVRIASSAAFDVDCSVLVSDGVAGELRSEESRLDENPLLCSPAEAAASPTTDGDYGLESSSPCLAGASPCGARIGVREAGCSDREAGKRAPARD